jgi:hypothetical protein
MDWSLPMSSCSLAAIDHTLYTWQLGQSRLLILCVCVLYTCLMLLCLTNTPLGYPRRLLVKRVSKRMKKCYSSIWVATQSAKGIFYKESRHEWNTGGHTLNAVETMLNSATVWLNLSAQCMISGFRCQVDENCALLWSSEVKILGPWRWHR